MIYPNNKPGFIIIGAQKCGTTTLHYYLSQHPSLKPGRRKEIHYFNRRMYFGESYDDYLKYFNGPSGHVYYETTPAYLYQPDVANNIYNHLPDVKMIAVLRDPVRRAFSAWNHYRHSYQTGGYIKSIKNQPKREGGLLYEMFYHGRDSFPTFRECLEIELDLIENRKECFEPALLRRGLYLDQLKEYWQYFPREQIKLIGFKDLVIDTIPTLKSIIEFVGVEGINWDKLNMVRKNYRPYSETMSGEDQAFLAKYFKEANISLFKEIGIINW